MNKFLSPFTMDSTMLPLTEESQIPSYVLNITNKISIKLYFLFLPLASEKHTEISDLIFFKNMLSTFPCTL